MSTPFACEEYRDVLIWYAAGQLSPRERETIAAHLANCAECRRELGPWRAVAATFASEDAAGPVDIHADAEWEHLLARLPDSGGRGRSPRSRSSGLPWRSSWSTLTHLTRNHATQLRTIELGALERYAPATGVDVSYPRRHSPAWLGLVASIALVVALIATFAWLHLGSTGASQHKLPIEQWVQLRGAPKPTGLPAGAQIVGLAMVSPSEGWAVGNTSAFGPDSKGTLTPRFTSGLILHYQNGHWSVHPDSPKEVALTNVFMISPTEGWAYGLQSNVGMVCFHLQDNRWQRADFPLPRASRPDAGAFGVGLLRIRTATDMWVVGSFAHPAPGKDEVILWHYDGQTWQPVQSPLSGVSDLVVTGPNEAYAVGVSSAVAQSGQGAYSSSMIVHLVGDIGTEVASSAANESLDKLYAISSSDVWATGETHFVGVPGGSPVPAARAEPKPVLYHFDGTRWASTPLATLHAPLGVTQVAFTGHDAAWGFTTRTDSSPLDPYDSGVVRIATAYQYTDGHWQQSPWPFTSILRLSSITYTAPDDAWAIGTYAVTWVKMHADTTSTEASFSGAVLLHFTHDHWTEYGQAA